jgi:hypothetical protein
MPTADGSESEAPSATKNVKHQRGKPKAKKLVKVIKVATVNHVTLSWENLILTELAHHRKSRLEEFSRSVVEYPAGIQGNGGKVT